MIGGRRVRTIDRDDVHAGQHLVEAFPIGCLELAFDLRYYAAAVMIMNLQAERACPAGDRLSDPSHADDAEALSANAMTEHPCWRPTKPRLFRYHHAGAFRQTARHRKNKRHRHVGG